MAGGAVACEMAVVAGGCSCGGNGSRGIAIAGMSGGGIIHDVKGIGGVAVRARVARAVI